MEKSRKGLNNLLYYHTKAIRKVFVYKFFYKHYCRLFLQPSDIKATPIIINNRNRYTYLKDLIDWLDTNGYTNYYVIDNDSTYGPLLQYYQTKLAERVFYLNKNVGHLAFWETGLNLKFINQYFIYTDSDVLPALRHQPRLVERYFKVLHQYAFAEKVGSALQLDDLPDQFEFKQQVVAHETGYWQNQIDTNHYRAPIDTTMALYLPNSFGPGKWKMHIRIAGDCLIRHQPWYIDSQQKASEELYYIREATAPTHWTKFDHLQTL
jgi:hypothetical protein